MSRFALTYAVKGNKWDSKFAGETPIAQQLAWIKRAMREGYDCDYLMHLDSDGNKRRFHPPKPPATLVKPPKKLFVKA